MSRSLPPADLALLRTLAATPGYRRWRGTRLPTPLKRLIDHADEQTLLTVTAYALRRIHRRREK